MSIKHLLVLGLLFPGVAVNAQTGNTAKGGTIVNVKNLELRVMVRPTTMQQFRKQLLNYIGSKAEYFFSQRGYIG